jgi:tetratricopeptide (TPR) repeat protein
LHPVQTQTVCYVIQGQLEGLASLFMLSIVFCFLKMQQSRIFEQKIILTMLFFILTFFVTGTKEIAIVTPLLVLLVDWFFVARASFAELKKRWWLHLGGMLIVLSAYVYFLSAKFFGRLFSLSMEVENNLGNVITERYDEMIKPLHFFISQFKVILHYLWIYLWPFNISVEYDWVLSKNFFALDCLLPLAILCIVGFIIYKLLQRDPTNIVGFAALWFAITMAPRSTIMPSPELLVDYKTYPASFSIVLLLAISIIKLFEFIQSHNQIMARYAGQYKIPHMLVLLLAITMGFGTSSRNVIWSSGLEFWGNIIKNAPGKIRAYNNYGVELAQKTGKFKEAIPYYQYAIQMDRKYRDPYNNLAVSYAAIKEYDKAIATLKQSLQINPNYPEAYNNIASFMLDQKDFEQAEKALLVAIKLRPYYGKAYYNLGRLYMEIEQPDRAWESFKAACTKADFDNETGFTAYAQCSLYLKKYDDAIFASQKVLEFNPGNNEVRFNLANAYFMTEQFDQAIGTYEQLIQQNPQDIRSRYNLAEAYLSAGKTNTALAHFDRLKNLPGITPNIFLRVAACHEKLGNPYQAKSSLEELLKKNIPQDARKQLEIAHNKLVAQYKLS